MLPIHGPDLYWGIPFELLLLRLRALVFVLMLGFVLRFGPMFVVGDFTFFLPLPFRFAGLVPSPEKGANVLKNVA